MSRTGLSTQCTGSLGPGCCKGEQVVAEPRKNNGTKFWPASFNDQMLWQTDFFAGATAPPGCDQDAYDPYCEQNSHPGEFHPGFLPMLCFCGAQRRATPIALLQDCKCTLIGAFTTVGWAKASTSSCRTARQPARFIPFPSSHRLPLPMHTRNHLHIVFDNLHRVGSLNTISPGFRARMSGPSSSRGSTATCRSCSMKITRLRPMLPCHFHAFNIIAWCVHLRLGSRKCCPLYSGLSLLACRWQTARWTLGWTAARA